MSKVYFITGAGRGMGVDFARSALAAGHRVVATGRRPEAVAEAIGDAENLLVLKLDVTVPADAGAAVRAAVERFGRIDVLINNAATFQAGFFEEVSPGQFRAQIEVNFFGALGVTRAVLPVMRRQRGGQVVTISSTAGVVAGEFTSAYAASKFALEGWMEALRPEVAPYGITTTIVEPGFFRTRLLEKESTILPALSIDDYAERTRQILPVWEEMNGKQAGDPAKLGRALVTLLDSPAPPERWVAGADAVQGVVRKADLLRQQAEAFPELSTTLDHDQPTGASRMNAMPHAAERAVTNGSTGRGTGRRLLLRLAGAGAVVLGLLSTTGGAALSQAAPGWDKTFPQSTRVEHRKVSFDNRLGIDLMADLYLPRNLDRSRRYPAIIVGHPFGGVKEQTSGLYAQTMAERGFITLAFDASYNGESGGQPHFIASPEAFVEDFSAAVDYLGVHALVDRDRIGVIGVCGSGGFSLAAAQIDPRIRAVATVSMYDIGQAKRQGLAERPDTAALRSALDGIAAQRWAEVDGAERAMVIGTPEAITARSTAVDREFYDYYRTPRGHHPRSTTAMTRTSDASLMLFSAFEHLDWISPRPVLFITGDRSHSRIFSEHAYRRASEPRELHIVPGAGHVDLYDRVDLIPWDKLTSFFTRHLR